MRDQGLMTNVDTASRDREILELRRSGLRLEEIGAQFGISRERVRQIVRNLGGVSTAEVRAARDERAEREEGILAGRIRALAASGLARSHSQLAELLDLDEATVRRIGGRELSAYLGAGKRPRIRWTGEDIIRAIQQASTFEWPLSRGKYQHLVDVGEIEGPSAARIEQIFGWSKACELAGVECPTVPNRTYQSVWTDDDLWHFVGEYIDHAGDAAPFRGYDAWRADYAPDAPSSGVIRGRLGTWSQVRREVLIEREQVSAPTGPEALRIDGQLTALMDDASRIGVWKSALSILEWGPQQGGSAGVTGLALGYVQSGKTTSMIALTAAAADQGYRIVVAVLGNTNLLLDQNRSRMEGALGIQDRKDYRWVAETNPSGVAASKRIADRIAGGRTVLIPVLKHAGRLEALASVLGSVPSIEEVPVLFIDDEADQASLNTSASAVAAESKTYAAIKALREAAPNHLYVQYTATPYAPLLLDAEDLLHPDHVEFLRPGTGYTGGREFFVDHARTVIRDVPLLDEQAPKSLPIELPKSLLTALGSYLAGAAMLVVQQPDATPVSMLVHSTQRNDVQERYRFLMERVLRKWRRQADEAVDCSGLPAQITTERTELVARGAAQVDDGVFLEKVRWVLNEISLWLVNSTSALRKIEWNVTPFHILIGGNKLDRGFTVEGLTVTYMNRPPSPQVDTLEQRARAFGYRSDQLPYCQFFATRRTIRSLRDIVFTEYDLRAQLQDHVEAGGTVHSWAADVGLMLPSGMKPTRDAVVRQLAYRKFGWHSVRRPRMDAEAQKQNTELVTSLGLEDAPYVDYGRLQFRTITMPLKVAREGLIAPWAADEYGPSWRRAEVLDALARDPNQELLVPVILLDEGGEPRIRKWDEETGFVNLFQGRDNVGGAGAFYPGDRRIGGIEDDPDSVVIQIHRVRRRGYGDEGFFTLAVHLGNRQIVRKECNDDAE